MNDTQLTFGRIKFGRAPRHSAALVAIPCGFALAALFALLTAHFAPDNSPWWFKVSFYWSLSVPVSVSVAWIAVVDTATIRGAVRNPEDTIERTWAKNATSNAFLVTLAIHSFALAVCIIFAYQEIANVLGAVINLQVIVGLVSYMYERCRK